MVNDHIPGKPPAYDVGSWDLWKDMDMHVTAVVAHADEMDIPEPTTRLMNALGLYLEARTQYADAEPLMRRALAIDEAAYGNEHPEVATYLNNLAHFLQATNRIADAEPLIPRALAFD